jgi:hypothetical protein
MQKVESGANAEGRSWNTAVAQPCAGAAFKKNKRNLSNGCAFYIRRRRMMDEARTLNLLAWIVGSILGIAFVLNAIALSMVWYATPHLL